MLVEIVRDVWRLLTFRRMSAAVRDNYPSYLAFGLIATWLAGMGRYWDNPRAELWQHLGLGSLGYVFVLSLLLWALIAPLGPQNWRYRNVLLFVSLTSPPAILYAIPVERFMSLEHARTANMAFLGVVALWRVALYWIFLRRVAKLPGVAAVTGLFLPLALIVAALSMLNLEHAVFEIMAGLSGEGTSADEAYGVVVMLSLLSTIVAPLFIILYIVLIVALRLPQKRWRTLRDENNWDEDGS